MRSDYRQQPLDQVLVRLKELEARLQALELELQALQGLVQPADGKGLNGHAHVRFDPPAETVALLAKLSPREREVLQLFADVRISKKIARALGTEVQTVRNQLASIRTKLGAATRDELADLVHELGPWLKNG